MKNLLLTATLLLIFSSCGNKNSNPDTIADKGVATTKYIEKSGDPSADIKIDEPVGNSDVKAYEVESPTNNQSRAIVADTAKKIVKEGDISFETNNIAATRKKILNSLHKLGGYVSEDNQTTDNGSYFKNYTLKIRIPAKNFDLLLDTVTSSAYKIDSKNISITDVTARFIDITTRLNNKKLLESRYQELLRKAVKVSDLLEIEAKLTEIRSDIESTQGQLNYLNKQVAYSSLTIIFYTKEIARADKPVSFGYKFTNALGRGWSFLQGLFYKTVSLWPFWVMVIVLYTLFKLWRRKKRMTKV
jgi:hypothetical protein